jgi:nicotinate phosphoribosyltransferase
MAPAIKISETTAKTQNPGKKDLYRVYDDRGRATADLMAIADQNLTTTDPLVLHHPVEAGARRSLPQSFVSELEPLLIDVMANGERLVETEPLDVIRARRLSDLDRLDPGVRRLVNPHRYHVSVTEELWRLKEGLIADATAGAAR